MSPLVRCPICGNAFGTSKTNELTRCFGCNRDFYAHRHTIDDIDTGETNLKKWGIGDLRVIFSRKLTPPGGGEPTDSVIAERVILCRGEGDSKDYYRIEIRIGEEPWRLSKDHVTRVAKGNQ